MPTDHLETNFFSDKKSAEITLFLVVIEIFEFLLLVESNERQEKYHDSDMSHQLPFQITFFVIDLKGNEKNQSEIDVINRVPLVLMKQLVCIVVRLADYVQLV